MFSRKMGAVALGVALLAAGAVDAKVYTTTSEGGIGDVVSLTNAFAQAKVSYDEVAIAPGVYDLTGVKMDAENHLRLGGTGNPVFRKVYGLGATRDETVLVGGGAADGVRVLNVWGGGCSVSNLTVTGGYSQGTGGGLYSQETCSDCVVTNNYARNGGGGIHCAKAFSCLIADNRTSNGYGGGLYLGNSTDCVISNNVTTKSDSNLGAGGAYSGTHTRTKFALQPRRVGAGRCQQRRHVHRLRLRRQLLEERGRRDQGECHDFQLPLFRQFVVGRIVGPDGERYGVREPVHQLLRLSGCRERLQSH